MKKQLPPKNPAINNAGYMCNCTITIHYGESINCIDFENLLNCIRKISQYKLAEMSNGQLEAAFFKNAVQIKSIEKGSAIINLILDIAPHLFSVLADASNMVHDDPKNCLDWVKLLIDALQLAKASYNNKDNVSKYVKKFDSILAKVKYVDFRNDMHNIRVRKDKNSNTQIEEINQKNI